MNMPDRGRVTQRKPAREGKILVSPDGLLDRDGGSTHPTTVTAKGRVWWHDVCAPMVDRVAEEVPVALVFNGVSHVVMMATPADLEDFALGFSMSEEIIGEPGEIYDLEVEEVAQGILVRLTISSRRFAALKSRRRNLAGRTGCGLCGVESLDQAIRPVRSVRSRRTISSDAVRRAFEDLPDRQVLNGLTKSIHAAAWARADGGIAILREDVGRHNALDKLIGAISGADLDPTDGFAVATSRCSYEMVQKAITAGVAVLATISAPTALALRIADEAGLTVVAKVQGHGFRVYTHPQRISGSSEAPRNGDGDRGSVGV